MPREGNAPSEILACPCVCVCYAGLHGAKVVISGRREAVLKEACAALASEGVTAHYVQVRGAGWAGRPPPAALA